MLLKDYITYQKDSLFQIPQNIKDNNGMIILAPNININEWKPHMEDLKAKIPSSWLCNSSKDSLRYLGQNSKGINLPYISLKVRTTFNHN